jgi:hypothetical protein
VYCRVRNRREDHEDAQFDFLGYTCRPREAMSRRGPQPPGEPREAGQAAGGRAVRAPLPLNAVEGFVTQHLTPAQRRTLGRVTRGLPQPRVLRDVMDEVYRPTLSAVEGDRRCRTDTALDKLARLRARVRRFKAVGKTLRKPFSPTLEKALVFLDDKLLPSMCNAVERGNRRHRKMQKSVYRVRSKRDLERRMALDLLREMHAAGGRPTRCTAAARPAGSGPRARGKLYRCYRVCPTGPAATGG